MCILITYTLNCYPPWHECMFETNNTPVFCVNHTRYCWTRIHTYDLNCLKASTDEEKQPNWNKTYEMNICLTSTTIFLGRKRTLVLYQ